MIFPLKKNGLGRSQTLVMVLFLHLGEAGFVAPTPCNFDQPFFGANSRTYGLEWVKIFVQRVDID